MFQIWLTIVLESWMWFSSSPSSSLLLLSTRVTILSDVANTCENRQNCIHYMRYMWCMCYLIHAICFQRLSCHGTVWFLWISFKLWKQEKKKEFKSFELTKFCMDARNYMFNCTYFQVRILQHCLMKSQLNVRFNIVTWLLPSCETRKLNGASCRLNFVGVSIQLATQCLEMNYPPYTSVQSISICTFSCITLKMYSPNCWQFSDKNANALFFNCPLSYTYSM